MKETGRNFRSRSRVRGWCACVMLISGGLLSGLGEAFGILDEAHSFAMQIAAAHVETGFGVREDYWSGEMKPGEKKIIRHQLFKGNEYWFWAGSSRIEARPSVSIYDLDGNLVQVESLQEMNMAAARVLPPKTGSYLILITVECEGTDPVDWALAYGYR